MTAAEIVAAALLCVGTVIVVAAVVGALMMPSAADRLHLITPITGLGGPLVGAATAIRLGDGLAAAGAALVVVLLMVTGVALQTAVGRTVVAHEPEDQT